MRTATSHVRLASPPHVDKQKGKHSPLRPTHIVAPRPFSEETLRDMMTQSQGLSGTGCEAEYPYM